MKKINQFHKSAETDVLLEKNLDHFRPDIQVKVLKYQVVRER